MLSAAEVAVLLNISRRHVYSLNARGELPGYRFGGSLRFDQAEIDAYRTRCRTVAPASKPVSVSKGVAPSLVDHDAALQAFLARRRKAKAPKKSRP